MEDTKSKMSTIEKGEKAVKNIIENYRQLEQSIVSQLNLYNDLHPTTTGSVREDVWQQIFEMIVPKKFVIDSNKNISREVDLAIDNSYTSNTKPALQSSTQTSTRPVRIFCGYKTELAEGSLLTFSFQLNQLLMFNKKTGKNGIC